MDSGGDNKSNHLACVGSAIRAQSGIAPWPFDGEYVFHSDAVFLAKSEKNDIKAGRPSIRLDFLYDQN
jgi:hypothetical protein